MAAKVAVGASENLYSFWSEQVTRALNTNLQTDPQPLLINMASAEYFKVIRKKELKALVKVRSRKLAHVRSR